MNNVLRDYGQASSAESPTVSTGSAGCPNVASQDSIWGPTAVRSGTRIRSRVLRFSSMEAPPGYAWTTNVYRFTWSCRGGWPSASRRPMSGSLMCPPGAASLPGAIRS
jgi:hypothetical protein